MGNLSQLAINDEGFIFNPLTGESWTVNQTGLFILKNLKEGKSQEEIAQLLSQEFDIDIETAQRDLIDFLDKMRSYKLI